MLAPPIDLDEGELVRALGRWGFGAPRLRYLPLGFGGHHWRAEGGEGRRAFVTVDDLTAGFQGAADTNLVFATLERAYGTAAALRDEAGLEFVVAPLADDEGVLLHRLGRRYAVSVAPFIDGTSSAYGTYESTEERRRMGRLLGRLHAASERIPPGLARRDDFRVPSRGTLTEALAALETPWHTGPFADPARALLAGCAQELRVRLREYDELAALVRERSDSWVLTHGEPHRGNVIVDERGRANLVDWDTTRVAPRERDLHMVLDEEGTGLDEYASAVGAEVSLDSDALELYRRWWDLADIATFTAEFRQPHEENENTAASFGHLRSYLTG